MISHVRLRGSGKFSDSPKTLPLRFVTVLSPLPALVHTVCDERSPLDPAVWRAGMANRSVNGMEQVRNNDGDRSPVKRRRGMLLGHEAAPL